MTAEEIIKLKEYLGVEDSIDLPEEGYEDTEEIVNLDQIIKSK